ncbi:MAG: DUF1508 domain-containing protein [Clostridia bacterium]|nr:DUF1508 domain-containing protein [Clostridia bacterium]
MEFIEKCIAYATAHPELVAILALAAVFIVFVLIIIISLSVKRSKAKKRIAAEKKAQEEQAKTEQERIAQEQAELARKAEEEKAEQARLAAEREEMERIAAEKKAQEEQAKTEQALAAQQAEEQAKKTEKKPAAKKAAAPAQKPAAQKPVAQKTAAQKPVAAKKAAVIPEDEEETENSRYAGKWLICRVLTDDNAQDEMYFFELRASNGEKLLSSEEYTSYSGALKGIETHKSNIAKGNFKITLSKKGDYIFKLLSGKNMLLCMGENYPTKTRCESAIESTKRFAQTAVIDENVQDYLVKIPVEDDTDVEPVQENYNGKWLISSNKAPDGEEVFYFELFANNGEKLLSSEEYTSYIGAMNGIQTHKSNIEKGNFRISLTKRGDYIYKLLNGNGQLLCLGEHYKTKRRCQSAVESVKRFALNSPVLTDPNVSK